MNRRRVIVICILLYFTFCHILVKIQGQERGDIRIMFYNAENYFDTRDDTLKNDEEFLPEADRQWNRYKFNHKTNGLFKVIASVGRMRPPEIICFAEIENRYVLNQLAYNTPLEKYPYAIIHFESPDARGIDVGLIYRKDKIEAIVSKQIPIHFTKNPYKKTRDILYAKFITSNEDTLHLFVNHWPSRRGGKTKSEFYRMHVAAILRSEIDSLFRLNKSSNIIITGDFNDEPFDVSILQELNAVSPNQEITNCSLYNLSGLPLESSIHGTYRYRAAWNMLDQFMVSGALLNERNAIKTCKNCTHIADDKFLLIEDKKYGGYKPFRTYLGPVYKGGFSDHLPIFLDLYFAP